jgi:hypothetical protein
MNFSDYGQQMPQTGAQRLGTNALPVAAPLFTLSSAF